MRYSLLPSARVFCVAAAASMLLACASAVEVGTRVQLVSAPAALARGQELTAKSGATVRVDDLHWTSSEVELLGCNTAWRQTVRLVIPEAHAHGSSSPTLMATPTIESAQSATEIELAELNPPAGDYCSVRYRVAPADPDAVGLDAAPNMLARSFRLNAAVGADPLALEPFEVVSSRELDIVFDIELELTESHRSARLRFEHDPARWFAELEPTELTGPTRERAVLESFRQSIALRVE